mmetsp:Transcript_2584/g.6950  ORF Transcript_2584/g.6950 Transcript_2584/m.6950 type:complete len:165 (+) Transcript_2584:527-1021(+)|eukprot:351906-Chlamydomonas_euryale.AAC.2
MPPLAVPHASPFTSPLASPLASALAPLLASPSLSPPTNPCVAPEILTPMVLLIFTLPCLFVPKLNILPVADASTHPASLLPLPPAAQWAVAPKSAAAGAAVGLLLDLPAVTCYRWMLDFVGDAPPDWLRVATCGGLSMLALSWLHARRLLSRPHQHSGKKLKLA